jgi:nitrite reductase/ring-hydroxylating ferredoxin subunit
MPAPTHFCPWFELPSAPLPGTPLGLLTSFADGHASMLTLDAPQGASPTPFRLLLLRDGTTVHAFVNRCPHFGVPLAARQEQLMQKPLQSLTCNVHYARFRWADGLCESGDCAGESLIPVPLEVRADSQVCIGHSDPVAAAQ